MKVKWVVTVILVASLLPRPGGARTAGLTVGQKVTIPTAGYGCLNLDDLKTFDTAKAAGDDDAIPNAMESSCDYIPATASGTVTGFAGGSYIQVQMDDNAEDNWFDSTDVVAQ